MLAVFLIAVAESVVHLFRIRSAVGRSACVSGAWTAAVGALRAAFVATGAQEVMRGASAWDLVVVYGLTAGVVTGATHHWANRRRRDG